jgi:pimeloyl-[acyl-carrier protein] methyl ester esterase
MTPHLVFVHGWGFDAGAWREIRAELSDFDCDSVDLGFYGRPCPSRAVGAAPRVAIGHSLGFLWLLRERPFAWRGLVSISGMPRFTKSADYAPGVPPRILDAMMGRLAGDPAGSLADFFETCGCAVPRSLEAADGARLAQGLRWLKDWDARPALDAEQSPVLALFAEDDAVVPRAMSEAAFSGRPNTRLERRADGGHALPVTQAQWCARKIREFVECLP